MSGVCYLCNFPCNPLSQTCSQCMRNGPPRNSLPIDVSKNELDTQSKVKKQDGTKGGNTNH